MCRECAARLVPEDGERVLDLPGGGSLPVDALLRYDEASRPLVLALKNGNVRRLARRFGPSLALLVPPDTDIDVVTWPPTSPARRRQRGFDHAELLARHTSRSLGAPAQPTLRRTTVDAQHGRSADERRGGVHFAVRRSATTASLPGTKVLIVDDVCTTGATLTAAAEALRSAGAASVRGLVVAMAP